MGFFSHSALVVTGFDPDAMHAATAVARALGLQVLGPSTAGLNDFQTMLVCPDGSKEGWSQDRTARKLRGEFLAWLDENHPQLDYVEVRFGGDGGAAEIFRDSYVKPAAQENADGH